jgi:2-dehydro-3-deoxygluconokinase
MSPNTSPVTSPEFVTLGETMVRLSPPGHVRLGYSPTLEMHIGGAESNVAVGLSRLGVSTAWVSRLPENPLGRFVAESLRSHGVDVSGITWAHNERMGMYYMERGTPPRSTRVWYDRANSAASRMSPDALPRDLIGGARWLHLTGITPALSESCAETVRECVALARRNGATVSLDVNYRALLWSPEKAHDALTPLCEAADVVIVAARDAAALWHATGDPAAVLQAQWGGTVIVTNGENGASANDGAMTGAVTIHCPAFDTVPVERIGAGDAFAAGVIFRLIAGDSLPDALRYGAAVAALKLTIAGDLALVNREEVEQLIAQKSAQSNSQQPNTQQPDTQPNTPPRNGYLVQR